MVENKPLCPDAAEDAKDGLIFDIQQDPYNYVMRVVFCRWKPFILRAMDFDEGKLTHFFLFHQAVAHYPEGARRTCASWRRTDSFTALCCPPHRRRWVSPHPGGQEPYPPCWIISTTGAGRRCSAGSCPSTRWGDVARQA